MTDKEKQAIFQDLYELYQEGELEEEAANWMKIHEEQYQHSLAENEQSKELIENDYSQLRHMKVFIYMLYTCFILLSIWMTVWFYF
ncbi:hypothetical protein [Bacillus sp. Bos-x628]|uniref:hypothetical protein n=1 Tax=Bacillus maqinnsis TaxID=3229854 RepID=UPI00338DC3D1